MKLKKEFQISLWEDFMDSKNLVNFKGQVGKSCVLCSWDEIEKFSENNVFILLLINDSQVIETTYTKQTLSENIIGFSYSDSEGTRYDGKIQKTNNELILTFDNANKSLDTFCSIHTINEPYYSFINERKICDIASNSLENPRAAYNVVFKSKTDGTHVLTFDMTSRYWDQQEQDFIENPIIKYLYNEAKIKLKYKDKWYDLIIKNCQENSKEKKYSYTCEDLFIDELGRNGYNVEFSTELGGNVNTITELADEALKGSDWTVDKNKSVKLIQKISEPVYSYKLTNDLYYKEINEDGIISDIPKMISKGEIIYVCYSSVHQKERDVDYQFYYNDDNYYETDEDGNFINTKVKYHISGEIPNYTNALFTFVPKYRGYRYIRSPKTEWLSKIKRQVTVYKNAEGKEYYGYKKTTYLSPEIAQNLLINSKPGAFDGYSGWLAEEVDDENNKKRDCLIEMTQIIDNNDGKLKLGEPSDLKAYYWNNGTKVSPEQVKFTNLVFKNNLKNIGAISKGDKFVVRLKQSNYISNDFLDSRFFQKTDGVSAPEEVEEKDKYNYFYFEAIESCSYKQLLNLSNGDFLKFSIISDDGTFKGGELFRYYTYIDNKGVKQLITPESTIKSQNLINNEYYYFTEDDYNKCNNEDDLQISFKSDEELDYVYRDNPFEKITTLEVKESNYFNIIQTLNEKFECWAKFEITHEENGAISVDDTGKREKKVIFCDYIGRENFAGFKYGVNLDSIQRTVDSKEITTKTIVKANSNEFAPSGSCNIARASQNPSGAQFILNLDYFTHQKVLKQFEVDNDLYIEEGGYLGYYTKLKRLNDALQEIEEKLIGIESNIIKADRDIQAANVGAEDFLEDISAINAKLANIYISVNDGTSTGETKTPTLAANNPIFYPTEEVIGNTNKWGYHNEITFYKVDEETGNPSIEYQSSPGAHIVYNIQNGRELVDKYNIFIKERYTAIENKRILEEDKAKLIAERDGKYSYIDVDGNLQEVKNDTAILPAIKQLDSDFYSKYSRFIREGTWTSEDYTDDNFYYLDACSVAYTSAFPKTTYSISVADIKNSIVPDELDYDYSAYDFECGDFTTIEDTEFFGWKEDGVTPYKEKVVISETEEHLDNISANKITVQNYKTQFDELFQRITAATQTLELKQGEYERASKVVNVNGEINKVFLQNTLYNNSLIIENIGAQGTSMDENGFISIDQTNPMLMTRMVGGGIVITEDGGNTWSTGISGKGINASNIKVGQLDTNRIKIMNGNDMSFFWDSEGILAYSKSTGGGYDYDKFVKFNRNGIKGENAGIERFSLNWDGLVMKDDDGKVVFGWDSNQGVLNIIGKIKFHSNDKKDAGERLTEIEKNANEMEQDIKDIIGDIDNLQNQIDGNISSWFYEGKPTLDNPPAKNWTDVATKNAHLGDLYYDQLTGDCYRFILDSTDNDYKWTPVTDTDVTEALAAARQAQATADGKMTVFIEEPKSPYGIGDIWIKEDKNNNNNKIILYSTVKREGQNSFNEDDWVNAVDYLTLNEYNTFKKEYDDFKTNIQSQVDGKAETWYQSNDPSLKWKDDYKDEREQHIGDLWKYTGENGIVNSVTRKKNAEYIYQQTDGVFEWKEMSVPNEVFDRIDGKAEVFTTKPEPPYNVGDLWLKTEINGEPGDIYKNISSKTAGEAFSEEDWVLASKYTDDSVLKEFLKDYNSTIDSINSQIDEKAQTWYQANDPSESWKEDTEKDKHLGDLWHDTSDGKEKIYVKEGTDYKWKPISVPDEIFDEIDRKGTIYTSWQTGVAQKANDILIPSDEITKNGKTFSKGKIYRSTQDHESFNANYWTEVAYTDDTVANKANNTAEEAKKAANSASRVADSAKGIAENVELLAQSMKDYFGFETTITATSVISPIIGGGSLLIGDEKGTHAQITNDGKFYANGGEIAGWTIGKDSLWGQSSLGKIIGLQAPNSTGYWGIAVGASKFENWSDAPFRVGFNGDMYATNAEISGKVTATSGKIANWHITTDKIQNYEPNTSTKPKVEAWIDSSGNTDFLHFGSYNADGTTAGFKVNSDGVVYASGAVISGEINATSGKIGGCTISNNTLTIGRTNITDGAINGVKIASNAITEAKLANGSVTNAKISSITANKITSGTLNGLQIGNASYSWTIGSYTHSGSTYGAIYGTAPDIAGTSYVMTRGVLAAGDKSATTWYTICNGSKSDRDAKKNIEELSKPYDKLFDLLKPVRFKYKENNSNRFHTGFIVQDVLDGVANSGLTDKDFAATINQGYINNDLEGKWHLRYHEFISLNTWQIQKLKTRVTDLETEISNLKLQLENLQNS